MKSLVNKTILITGGTGALGEALVCGAREQGARVYFTYAKNNEKAEALEKKGAHGYQLDLTSREEIKQCKAWFKEKESALDILINNAACVQDHTIVNMTEKEWDAVIGTNLTGAAHLTQQFIPLLFKSTQGKIFNVISARGLHGGFGQANYAAAKGGLIALTQTLAQELGRKKILVNAINPGFMVSKMTREIPEKEREENKKRSCINRFSDPYEVAAFILYLASDRMTCVSGQVFHYDSRIY